MHKYLKKLRSRPTHRTTIDLFDNSVDNSVVKASSLEVALFIRVLDHVEKGKSVKQLEIVKEDGMSIMMLVRTLNLQSI